MRETEVGEGTVGGGGGGGVFCGALGGVFGVFVEGWVGFLAAEVVF